MKPSLAIAAFVLLLAGIVWAENGAAPPAKSAVDFIGESSNEVYYSTENDPHVSGYTLVLYRQDGHVFGNFYSTNGLEGDPPAGRINAAALSGKQLSFTAKLTTGTEINRQAPRGRLAHDWFEFTGRLSPNTITGKLIHKDGYDLQNSAHWQTEKVTLKKRKNGYAGELPASYQNWLAQPLPNGPEW